MSKNTCKWMPTVPSPYGGEEEPSRLFKDLISKGEGKFRYPRQIALMLYASYLSSDIESKMEAVTNPDGTPRYKKNRQGQFNAKDVVEFLDFEKAMEEISNISIEAYRLGATDSIGGKDVDFTNAEEALRKVRDFNDNHKGLVAYVIERPDKENTVYNIAVYEKNAHTVDLGITTKERLQAWDIYKNVFNQVGIDIEKMPDELKDVFSAYDINLDQRLLNLTKTDISDMYRRDALILFSLDSNSAEVQRLVSSFGSIENAAQALDDFNHNGPGLPTSQQTLLKRAIAHAKQLGGIDINALVSQIDNLQKTERANSPETAIKDMVHKLNKKYNIGIDEIFRVNDKIKNLSDANIEAIIQLKRQITELNKERGNNAEGRRLELLYNKMMNELNSRHYYTGIIDYLAEAAKNISEIDNMIIGIPQTGSERERVFNTMKTLYNINRMRDQYYNVIAALASDSLTMDEAVSQANIDSIRQQARDLKNYFDRKDDVLDEMKQRAMHDFIKLATDGKMKEADIQDVLDRALREVGTLDKYVYSIGTANNILLSASGTIMRNQEDKRKEALRELKYKVDEATDKLYKAGYNSRFMYEDSTHIVSDIDWKMYDDAKKRKRNSLKKAGLYGFELKQALEDWEDQNTEERLVDKKNNRNERVPNQQYRKREDFQEGWSKEQKEYYDTMMELKGELETLYPDHARNYYLAPQTRRNMVDAIVDSKGNVKDIGKAIGRKVADQFVVREDDTNFTENALLNGDETEFAEGDYDNTPRREVPIYFQNKVKEGELLMDFSAGLMRYASSAINYDAMNEIRDVMEFVKDYAESKSSALPKSKSDVANNKFVRGIKEMYNYSKTNNVGTVLGAFMEQHLYGVKRSPNENKYLAKTVDTIVKYTSFKGLVFNTPGAMSNALMGVCQIIIDAGGGEFFGWKDAAWATTKLFGDTGAGGSIMELVTNNTNHKGTLFMDLFDPEQSNYQDDKGKRYHKSWFRTFMAHDCSYIGYGAGEYFIHLLPMYAVLHNKKVRLNGEKVSLYDAFDVVKKDNGSNELVIKQGVTDLDGNAITMDSSYMDRIKGIIRGVNQSMHGAMNEEDKGLIHQYCLGRMAMNFRQWMVGHYSRRFRQRHWDYNFQDWREGYWQSLWHGVINDDVKEIWQTGHKKDAILEGLKDFMTFMFRASTQWENLNDMQRSNIKRARTETLMLLSLVGLGFALGEPDDHKKEFWRRWWIYQNKRLITDTEASMPLFPAHMMKSAITVLQSPMAGINTINSLMYILWGLTNGDLWDEIQSGPHKGENRYWRNVIKYDVPFVKDWERLQTFDTDESLFKVFDSTPSNH